MVGAPTRHGGSLRAISCNRLSQSGVTGESVERGRPLSTPPGGEQAGVPGEECGTTLPLARQGVAGEERAAAPPPRRRREGVQGERGATTLPGGSRGAARPLVRPTAPGG